MNEIRIVILASLAATLAACQRAEDPAPVEASPAPASVQSAGDSVVPGGAPHAGLAGADFDRAKFLYFNTCAGCHGTLRKGATGPELSPQKIQKLGLDYVKKIVHQGTPQGMPSWGAQGVLAKSEIDLLANYLSMEAPQPPMMNRAEMEATWQVLVPPEKRPTAPAHARNWENFFGVILRDAGKVAIID